jgi:serine protease
MIISALILCLGQSPSVTGQLDQIQFADAIAAAETSLHLKISDGLDARAQDWELVSMDPRIQAVAVLCSDARVEPLLLQSKESLLALRQRGVDRGAWPPAPDMSLWFRVRCNSTEQRDQLVMELRSAQGVSHCYAQPAPAIPPTMLQAPTDWTDTQDYFDAPTNGTHMYAVGSVLGARGRDVRMTDCEYDWVIDHEDLGLPSSRILGGTPIGGWSDHGTAVLGEIWAQDNGFGMTGGTINCEVWMSTEYSSTFGFNPTQAIINATANSSADDVILLEMQTFGPGGYCPEEWTQASFDAIQTATLAGIHVIEAGGNGGLDLDGPSFNNLFDLNVRDSGAVIVGAANSRQLTKSWFTSRGSRIDCQAWGDSIPTAGYGDLYNAAGTDTEDYTSDFGGTSGASPIVTSAAVSVIGAMKAHGMTPPSPLALRDAFRQTGTPQPASDIPSGRIGSQPDMEELFDWFGLPDGLRQDATATLGGTVNFTLEGQANENWALYLAFDHAISSTIYGTRVIGNQGLRLLGSGTLNASGEGSFSQVVPNRASLIGREFFTQVLFTGASNDRFSNGGVTVVR